jgi:two-component system cell cycle sensor histidine kinase/response regulator CckA
MKILHLENDPRDAMLVRELVETEFPGCVITNADSRERFIAGLAPGADHDLILADFSLPGFDGFAALALAREHAPGVPFVFLSGSVGEERAIAALRGGAYDYVLKDNMTQLPVVVRHALDNFERRRKTETNQRRLIELAGIIKRAAGAIIVSDMAGRITLWNDGAARLYGVTEAEVKGRTAEEIFPSRELARVRDAREATLEAGEFRKELSVTTRDGRDIVIEVHMSLVRDTSGQPTARLTIATDITEKKRQEEQVLRAQRVEILGMLAAGIAHDFNNVLMPVGMVASLLRRSITNPADVQMLDILENSAKRGAGLVRQILGFARGVGGDVQLTQIEHIIRDVGEIIRASFPKSIVLVLEAGSDLRPIQADPTQIQQILLNLAVNARDAMLPLGGLLTIGAENRVLDASAAGALEGSRPKEYLVLEVADTGSGVTPDVLARMWEPFFTTKDEGKGTGLGLSTVRGIAAAHGGFVTVDTRVGLGTTFRVFLPAAIGSGLPGRPIGDES